LHWFQNAIAAKKVIIDIAGFDDVQKELTTFLTRLFDIMYPAGIVLGGIALAASLYRSISYGWYSTSLLHVGMYLVAVVILIMRRRLPMLFIFSMLLALISIEVVQSFYERGLASAGMMNLAIFCIFTGIFLGKRAGIIAVATGALMASLIGAAYCTGMLKMSVDANDYLLTPITWIVQISCFLMYVVCIILTVNYMQRRVVKSLHESKETASRLEVEIAARKQVEKELRQSEEKYRGIFDNSIMGIFQSSPEGYYLNANPAFARMHGFDSPEELMNSVTDIGSQMYVSHDDRKRYMERVETEGFVEGQELQTYHKTGEKLWVLTNTRNVSDEKGRTLYYEGTIQNITDRKRAEEALRESESKFRDLAEKSLVGVYLVQDNMFKYVNSKSAEILGYGVDEITNKMTAKQMVFPEDWPLVEENLQKRMSGEVASLQYEFRVLTKNKVVKKVEVYSSRTVFQGKPALIGMLLDITERKRAEEALRESEARLRQVIDLVPHFVFAKDRDGRFVLANRAVADAYGTTVEGLIGKTDVDFNPNIDEVEQFSNDDLLVIDSGKPMEIPEETITDSKGQVRILQTTKIPFTLPAIGDAVLGVSTDITELKLAEKALRESEERYRNIFENAVEGIFQTTPEGRLFNANPALARMMGFDSPEELMATIHDLAQQIYFHSEDRARSLEQLREHGFVEGLEIQMCRKDRKVIWTSMSARALYDGVGNLISIDGTLEDITERKSVEKALLES
jgi:PAS domain S-box-containing protein